MNELKNRVQDLYRTQGFWVKLGEKATLTLSVILLVNLYIGTMPVLNNSFIMAPIAIIMGLLPTFITVLFVVGFITAHLVNISIGVAAIFLMISIILFVLCLLFSPRNLLGLVISFIVCMLGGVYAVPMILGVIVQSLGTWSVITGVSLYGLIATASINKKILAKADLADSILIYLEAVIQDKVFIVSLIAVIIGFILCTNLKKLHSNESWKLGIVTAFFTNFGVVLVGNFTLGMKISLLEVAIGSLIGLILGMILEFMIHDVDYKSMEYVEFEDGEYYYYVKAIPKRNPVNNKENMVEGNRPYMNRRVDNKASGKQNIPTNNRKNVKSNINNRRK